MQVRLPKVWVASASGWNSTATAESLGDFRPDVNPNFRPVAALDGLRFDVDPSPFAIEEHFSVLQSEQRKVLALSDIRPRMPFVADLTDQNIAGADSFPREFLDASTLSVGVATVAT